MTLDEIILELEELRLKVDRTRKTIESIDDELVDLNKTISTIQDLSDIHYKALLFHHMNMTNMIKELQMELSFIKSEYNL